MAAPRDWILPLLSAVLLFAAFLTPALPANLVFLVPVLVWMDRHAGVPGAVRFRAMLRFTVPAYAVALYWVWAMLWISWLAGLMWLGLLLLFAIPNAAALAVAGWVRRSAGWSWGVALPACWLPVEWARTFGDLRMTADQVAYSLAKYPFLCQIADVVGPFGLGAVLLAVNGTIADLFVARGRGRARAAVALVVLVAGVLGYDAWAWQRWSEDGATVRVGIVQPDVPIDEKNDEARAVDQLTVLNRLTFEAADRGAELVVWPETARPEPMYHWLDHPATYRMPELSALARALDVAMLVGSEYARVRSSEDYDFYNAAFAIHRDGTLDPAWAAKVYLVPFVEKVPFERVLGPLVEGRGGEWRWLSGGFVSGPEAPILPFSFGRVGVTVCFEQLFPELPRKLALAGADLQVVLTNDAWWGRTAFQGFQRDALRLRAIESRTSFVRAANTGISGVVDARGRYRVESGLFEETVLVQDVPLRTGGPTPYVSTGDAAAWVAVAIGLVGVGIARRRDADRRTTFPPASPGGGTILGGVGGSDPPG